MSFHVGGHKPKPPVKKLEFAIGYRLLVGALGAALVWSGLYRFEHGMFTWLNWLHQPAYATGLIPAGAVVFAVALIPASWIDKAAARLM
jgi:hypothetical protein